MGRDCGSDRARSVMPLLRPLAEAGSPGSRPALFWVADTVRVGPEPGCALSALCAHLIDGQGQDNCHLANTVAFRFLG